MTTDHPQKITFGEMRASGVRDVLVYCRDQHCSHHIRISARVARFDEFRRRLLQRMASMQANLG